MKVFDSKKQQLAMQDVILYSIENLRDKLPVPMEQAILLIIEEAKLPNTDMMLLGNTVFISHYSEDGKQAVMRALNVDIAKNYMRSGEVFIRYMLQRGVESFVTQYDVESYGVPLKQIQKNKLGTVTFDRTKKGTFLALVQLNKPRKKNAVQPK